MSQLRSCVSVWLRGLALGGMVVCALPSLAFGQVVQLPSFRNFSYSGSAWVPDGGTASLAGGGYSQGSAVSRGWGPYSGRAGSRNSGLSSLTASVQIIDLQALDDAILNANVARDPNNPAVISSGSPASGGRRFLSGLQDDKAVDTRVSPDPTLYARVLAGGQNIRETDPASVEADIRYYLRQGKAAERANRIQAARVYYRMAIEAMTPEMVERYRNIIDERKAAKEKAKADAKNASRVQF